MTVVEAVCARLLAASGVTALVSTRVFQLVLPQSPVLPAIRVQLVDEPRAYHLHGADGSIRTRVQIDSYASAHGADALATAEAVADAADAAISGQRWQAGSPAIEIRGAFREGRLPIYEAEELRVVRVIQDYFVWSRQG